jgi:hypothetical protein
MSITKTDIERIRVARGLLQNDIMIAVNKAVDDFRAATNLQISSIRVGMIDTRTYSDTGPRYVVGPVTADVDL